MRLSNSPPLGSEPVTEAQAVQKSVRITGTVVDAKGAPVVGATVIETGTQQGKVTGSDGKFVMNVQPSNKIQVSYVGYVTQTLAIGATTSFNVVLKEDAAMLDDVVVVGYGAVRKADLTGSVSSISADALVRGGKTDAVGAMQGALPGVQIQRSNNKPGGTYNILIRGLNTISGSTAPLVVVDGVPGAALENINPDDIERIDILKDASSTAIYGSRATNGVVLVTTKRGQQGDVNITYNGYVGFRKYTNLPDMMSGDEYAQIARETARAKNNNVYKDDSQVFTASELKAIEDGNYFDWLDAVAGTAVMTNHTVSASGGNDVTTYALSAGYYFEDGMVKPQEFSRYNLRAAIDVKPVDYLKFGINMYGTHSVRDTGNSDVTQDAIRMRPTYHPTNLVTGAEEWAYSNGQYNPLVAQKHEWNKNKIYNLLGNVYLEIMPLKNLSVKTTFSPDITFNEKGQYRGKYTKANKGANEPTSNYAKDSYMNWTWDNQISYKFEKGDHRFDVTGVFSML
ncbi:MAG: SusC/RagA family TonB-linked outer membrane protein, partial [Alistipes sp.]|nr:SusC/RagA family TonB-linked outer membrane protein [Alistipes sp.]